MNTPAGSSSDSQGSRTAGSQDVAAGLQVAFVWMLEFEVRVKDYGKSLVKGFRFCISPACSAGVAARIRPETPPSCDAMWKSGLSGITITDGTQRLLKS